MDEGVREETKEQKITRIEYQEEIMSDTSSASSSGIGEGGLLAIVFIVLKLLGKITWSWWWVLSPLWIPIAVALVLFFFVAIGMVIGKLLK